jgi:hypothetical protein
MITIRQTVIQFRKGMKGDLVNLGIVAVFRMVVVVVTLIMILLLVYEMMLLGQEMER